MPHQAFQAGSAIVAVASCALLVACGTSPMVSPSPSSPATTSPTVQAKVTGTPDQLVAFDKALRPLLGTEPVACTVSVNAATAGCENLQSGPPAPSLKDLTYGFYGADTWVYEKLGVAFNQAQAAALAISPWPKDAPDCSGLPLPCTATPWCPNTGGCSKQKYPCVKC